MNGICKQCENLTPNNELFTYRGRCEECAIGVPSPVNTRRSGNRPLTTHSATCQRQRSKNLEIYGPSEKT